MFGKPHRRGAFAGLVALALAGCGDTQLERTASGGALGAAAGALTAGVSGGDEFTGAVIGGAAGAVAGVLSEPDRRRRGGRWR